MLGQVIHGYRVERALSEDKGGFGDVFFATHVDSGAEAVVKVLKPEMSAQRDIVARFFNEARAAASVHHPGVVQIHNVGYHGDRAYLLMERLRGNDLEERLAAGPLPVDRAVMFMRQAAGAVGAAHDRGIVHRDLKPANLFVVEDPDVIGGERVKVLDFGIAKLTAEAGAGKTQGVFGTPSYMSPEQCASTGAVDGRADLYSLGCIFYELVCGRPPFGHGGLELIAAHLRDTPPPPRAIAPWLPPAIEQVILGLLEKQPDRRIPSCAALIAALDDAARASGLPGASAPYLPAAGSSAGMPYQPTGGFAVTTPHPTTLGAAASAATVAPARRGLGVWIGLGAVAVVAGAIAVVLALPGHRTPVGGAGGSGSSGGSGGADGSTVVLDGPRDAGAGRVAPDAGAVAAAPVDAAVPEPSAARPPRAGEAEVAEKYAAQGRSAMYAGRYRRAQQYFEEAVAHDPSAKHWFNLALADFQVGQLEETAIALREVQRASPTPAQATKMHRLFQRVAREAQAQGRTLHTPITAAELGGPETPSQDLATGEADGSGVGSSAGSDPGPGSSAVSPEDQADKLYETGKSEAYAGHPERALAVFTRAYELTPQPRILLGIGTMQYQLGRCAEARRTLQRIGPTWPKDPAANKAEKLLAKIGDCPAAPTAN